MGVLLQKRRMLLLLVGCFSAVEEWNGMRNYARMSSEARQLFGGSSSKVASPIGVVPIAANGPTNALLQCSAQRRPGVRLGE